MTKGRRSLGRSSNPDKLEKLCQWLRKQPGGVVTAGKLEEHISFYRKYSEPRNCIAHSKCVGVDGGDPDYIVFLRFERFEKYGDGKLPCLRIPIDKVREATRWAEALSDAALKMEGLWRSFPHCPPKVADS